MTEIAVAAWRPTILMLLRRALLAALVMLVVLALLNWFTGVDDFFLPALFLTVIYFVTMEDPLAWARIRREHWRLTTTRLHYDGDEGSMAVPLGDITKTRLRLDGGIVITLTSGKKIVLRGLPNPKQVRATLDRTRGAE